MHLHTDHLTTSDMLDALACTGLSARGVMLDYDRPMTTHRSRSRHHRITFYLIATDGHGRRWANSGKRGADTNKAALYDEWGALLGELFHRDPDAIAGQYNGADEFLELAARYRHQSAPGGDEKRDAPRTLDEWRSLYTAAPVAS